MDRLIVQGAAMTPEHMHELAAGLGVIRKQHDLVAGLSDANTREKAEAEFEFARRDMSLSATEHCAAEG